jgi:hypothetical protein
MKSLIYFVIGGDKDYSELLRYSINTIRCHKNNDKYDILIMCDKQYSHHLGDLKEIADIFITGDNENTIQACMRKIEIFRYARISEYEKVLYLDCDTVIVGDLDKIFEVTKAGYLNIVTESKSVETHKLHFFNRGDKPYDQSDFDYFMDNSVYAFNCGQFSFVVDANMRSHFNNILLEAKCYSPSLHFYEQSFMNEYFNRKALTSCLIERYVKILFLPCKLEVNKDVIIYHFANASIHYVDKIKMMRDIFGRHKRVNPQMLESRSLIETLPMPQGSKIAEIGVLRGEFSEYMITKFEPDLFYAIDPWCSDTIASGDQDGNNVCSYNGDELYKEVSKKLGKHECVRICRNMSYDESLKIDPFSLDLIYIDGDHSYEAASTDLKLAMKWVRYGGWICGHDYDTNSLKTSNTYDFGVKKAVEEFCIYNGMRVWFLMMDGCISFAIRK